MSTTREPFFQFRRWRNGVDGQIEPDETKEFYTLESAIKWLKKNFPDPRSIQHAKRAWAEFESQTGRTTA